MLLNFAFNNVKSFKEWRNLSLISNSKIQQENDHEIQQGRIATLKNVGVFGANASGKSNIVKGLLIAKEFVSTGRVSEQNVYFLDNKDAPSSFSFLLSFDEELVSYDFSFKNSGVLSSVIVIEEEINILNKDGSVKSTVYSKKDNIFMAKNDKVLGVFYNRYFNTPNILFLTYMNTPEKIILENKVSKLMNDIYRFFSQDLIVIESFGNNYSIINDTNVNAISNVLKEYDTGIASAEFVKDEKQDFLKSFPQQFINMFLSDPKVNRLSVANEDELICIKKTPDNIIDVQKLVIKHKNINSTFSFHDESHGTKRLFYLIGLLLGGNIKNKVFVIDEIEKGCHPNLIVKLIKDFQRINSNNNAQIIFTTHLSSLMDSVLRRDEIYFVQKDNFGVSNIYSLLDYKDRTTQLSKRYLEGRFGAVPNLGVNVDATII